MVVWNWLSGADRMKREMECNEAWEGFPELPGERLSWYQVARWVSEIVTRDGRQLATVEGPSLFPLWYFIPRPPRRVKIDHYTYEVKRRWTDYARVITPEGMIILSFRGMNRGRRAGAVAHLSDGQSLRFPVQGTSKWNAIMTATDDSGRRVFRIRKVHNPRPAPYYQGVRQVVEILVEPGRRITPELLLVMATGYHNLDSFFARESAGGG
jgi:hypothetical protein